MRALNDNQCNDFILTARRESAKLIPCLLLILVLIIIPWESRVCLRDEEQDQNQERENCCKYFGLRR